MEQARATPVAVIGMACRLPGGINSPEELWAALLRGDDLVVEIPTDRWDPEEYYDPEPGVAGRSVSRFGAFIDDVGGFDADFFGISEREAIAIDPQHRILLETAWEAVEHAGFNPHRLAGTKTGVFAGVTHNDYSYLAADAGALEGPYGFTGTSFSLASGRIAYALGARGPAISVDTACSSSLTALHLAFHSLIDGESDMALAGGVSVLLEPRKAASGSAAGMLSPSGRCRAFDVGADGFVSAEGCVVVMLKRFDDAVRDGDRVLAVLRGVATNQDGRTVSIATPSQDAQIEVYTTALANAGVDAATIGLVEAHGTGTPVGDPLEYASVAAVYGSAAPCALGSVKTNFGHAQSAAGALGFMKAVLAVQHGVIPRNLHFTDLPEAMSSIDSNLFVPQCTTPWPVAGAGPRRAAVSSYGLSGTNVHAIVEQAPPHQYHTPAVESATDVRLMFPLSASSAEELHRTAERLSSWVQENAQRHTLSDIGYTLSRRRGHRQVRTTVCATSTAELADFLAQVADGVGVVQPAVSQDDRGPVWVFSGQGSQWAGMGSALLASEPVFAAAVAEIEPLIAEESYFSVTEAMSGPDVVTGIDRVQPTVFAIQVALASAMKAYGVVPAAVVGHSMGEVAAAVVSGALSLRDGVRVICRRSRLMLKLARGGAMASVELPAPQVLSELGALGVNEVNLAVVASPQSTVVAGARAQIRKLVAGWERRGVMAREVAVDVASHSAQVDPILDELCDQLAELSPSAPAVAYYSATEYDPRDVREFDSWYWVDNLRHTVRFAAAIQAALEDGHRVFAELSPHPLLSHAIEQTARNLDITPVVLAAMRREQDLPQGLHGLVADVYCAGGAVDFAAMYPVGEMVDVPLPTWAHRNLLLDRRDGESSNRGGSRVLTHPLMGPHIVLPEAPERHVWQGETGTQAHPWLADHEVHDVAVLPGAAYCEMALTAAQVVLGENCEVRDVCFEEMLLLDEQTSISSEAVVVGLGVAFLTLRTGPSDGLTTRATARLAVDEGTCPASRDIGALLSAHSQHVEGANLRSGFSAAGITHGAAFAGLTMAHTTGRGTVIAEIALPGPLRSQQSGYTAHPALLDACFQAVLADPRAQTVARGGMLLPLGVGRLRAYSAAGHVRYCFATVTGADDGTIEADLELLDEHGAVVAVVDGLRLGTGLSERGRAELLFSERLLGIDWTESELPQPKSADAGSWLIVNTGAHQDSLNGNLVQAMTRAKAEYVSVVWPVDGYHGSAVSDLRTALADRAFSGIVVVTAPAGTTSDGDPQSVAQLVHIVQSIIDSAGRIPRLYVLTRDALSVRPGDMVNLGQAGLRGFLRVLGMEYPHLNVTQIDIDNDTATEHVVRQILSGSLEDETAWRDNCWRVARLYPAPLSVDDRHTAIVDQGRERVRLTVRSPGDLESLEMVALDRVAPGPGEIEVRISTSSVNFADVLVAFGQCPSFEGRLPELGTDFAGVVTAVGPGVSAHREGDHVAGVSGDGCWGTFVTCAADLAVRLPDKVSEAQAAAVATAAATAWYGLVDLARMSSTDKVLIHSGTGGVGQAAIAIAKAAGAQIFATAGSQIRRQLLRDWGVEYVYDSRSTDFADQIRRDTGGYGVDIVLNSLTGPLQRAGIELLAFNGRFVEIGKRDIYGDTRVGLFPFRRNLTFYAVDLALMSQTHPGIVRGLLDKVFQLTADGYLAMPHSTHYPLAEAATALRVMGTAQHTGKLLLDIPRSGKCAAVVAPEQVPVFRPDGAYLVTGGLGGLGLFLAEKMAASGCGRIVLTSRTQPGARAREIIDLIRTSGADVIVECGDIADAATALRLCDVATATGLPLRGIVHAAAVVEDATVVRITDDLIERDWLPKVHGALNLHAATAAEPLDWFCMFSSAAALVGSPGQGAYAAANSWLDGFAAWRRAQGLPATCIAWGAWAQIGRGTGVAEGDAAITPDEGAYAFEALLRHARGYVGYAPVLGAPWLAEFAQRSPFAAAFKSIGQKSRPRTRLRTELESLSPDEWPTHLRRVIAEQVSLLLRRSVDPDRPLPEYGLDSLGNLELRTRIEAETGIRVSAMMITTIRGLAEHVCQRLVDQQAASTTS